MKEVRIGNEGSSKGRILPVGNNNCLLCPYSSMTFCNNNCAWFDIQTRTIYQTAIGYEMPIKDIKVVTCKGTPIAKLVENTNDNP